jgi:hypothetical protein
VQVHNVNGYPSKGNLMAGVSKLQADVGGIVLSEGGAASAGVEQGEVGPT